MAGASRVSWRVLSTEKGLLTATGIVLPSRMEPGEYKLVVEDTECQAAADAEAAAAVDAPPPLPQAVGLEPYTPVPMATVSIPFRVTPYEPPAP